MIKAYHKRLHMSMSLLHNNNLFNL